MNSIEKKGLNIFLFRYAGKIAPRPGHSPDEHRQKMRSLKNLVTYENTPSALYENILDRFVWNS
jgi:hypothetical protein